MTKNWNLPLSRVNITIGYLPNETRTEIEVYITCPTNENHLAWIFPLPNDEEQKFESTDSPISPVEAPLTKRIEPKTTTIRKEQSNEGNR